MKKKTIKIPIYFGDLTIIHSDGWEEVNKKYEKQSDWSSPLDNGYEACVFPAHYKSGYTQYVVAFKRIPKGSTIAHECVHLVNHVFQDRGLVLDMYNDETQAYLTGWFFEQIERFFNNIENGK
ncbi:hypothetical protein [Chryseobacterium sp. JV274]|uniref:hypothetical protein n=1 Tax=Chryseobacterium sp. JV274 TaxID=1932669 RepID=UPI0015C21132|nr:hypothetical protein [Chryseobacterium sp. JV274]CAD0220338.1 conserved protein of unknown function [Chryseobacterium sp. JV274]